MMNIPDLTDRFWQEGFLHLPGFFEADIMDALDRSIQNHFGVNPNFTHTDEFVTKSNTEVVPWFPQREGCTDFDVVEDDPRFQAITKAILGEGWCSQYCMVMFSKKGTAGQAWHQDCPPEGPFFNLNRLIYTHALEQEIGGGVVIKPGSHKAGVLPVGDPHGDLDGQLILYPKKGDLVLLHGYCWHRVLPIRFKHRFSINYRSAPAGAPDELTDICVYRNIRYKFSTSEVVEDRTMGTLRSSAANLP